MKLSERVEHMLTEQAPLLVTLVLCVVGIYLSLHLAPGQRTPEATSPSQVSGRYWPATSQPAPRADAQPAETSPPEPPQVFQREETKLERCKDYKAWGEAQFNAMFPYGTANPLQTEVNLYRQARITDLNTYVGVTGVQEYWAFVVVGTVDVRYRGDLRHQTLSWRLRYEVHSPDYNAQGHLVLVDCDGLHWDPATRTLVRQ